MKNKLIILLLTVFALGSNSCSKDFLETVPSTAVAASTAFTTTKSAMAALNGIYRSVIVRYQASQGHSGHPAMMLILDAMGEDMVFTTTSNSWHFNEMRWIAHRTETGTMPIFGYEMYYRVISNANNILANIDNATGPSTERNMIKGEALALRAWAYMNLVQMYGKRYDATKVPNTQLGVPLILEPTTEARARNTVEEVYTQIKKDLTDAIGLLTATRNAKSHINQAVARGLMARVALTMQDWPNASKFSSEARTGLTLMSNAQYQEGFQDITNPEWMWGFDHIEEQTEFFGGYHSYISCNFNSSVIRTTPRGINRLLYDALPATDVRSRVWVRAPTSANSVVPPGGVRQPYMGQKFRLPGTPTTSTMGDVPYMRVAEMWLIEAEAKARLGDNAGAQTALHTLIVNRDPSYVRSTRTGQALIDEIMFHRRVEFWGEGFRWFDLKRLNLPLNRNGMNHIASVIQVYDVPAGDVRWEFLIPRRELDSNPLAVQNPL